MTSEDTFEIELCDEYGSLLKPVVITTITNIEPMEFEGSDLFYHGGAELEDWKASGHPEAWFPMVCDDKGLEGANALVLWYWARWVLPEIDIPVHRYPMTR